MRDFVPFLTPLAMVLSVTLPGCTPSTDTVTRWEKQDRAGVAMAIQDGPWACVFDHDTGLLWESKSDNEGLRYAGSTYYWRLDERTYDGGCMFTPGHASACDVDLLVTATREQALCGRTDWRLPSMAELETLRYDTGFVGNPLIATGFFPHTGREAYWAADPALPFLPLPGAKQR